MIKACSSCKLEKSINDYHKKGRQIDSSCKACISIIKRQRYQLKKKLLKKRKARVMQAPLNNLKVIFKESISVNPITPHWDDQIKLFAAFLLEEVIYAQK